MVGGVAAVEWCAWSERMKNPPWQPRVAKPACYKPEPDCVAGRHPSLKIPLPCLPCHCSSGLHHVFLTMRCCIFLDPSDRPQNSPDLLSEAVRMSHKAGLAERHH